MGAYTLSATANATISTNGAPFVSVECLTSSSLTVTVQGDFGSGTVRNMRSWLLSSTATETSIDPGTTSATLAAQDVLMIPTCGAKFIQITRQAGSGTINSTAYGGDGLTSWMIAKLIDGGISASVEGSVTDDTAFTPATSKVIAVGYFADETATDSVDEGDVGAPRMTLDRRAYSVPSAHTAGGTSIYSLVAQGTSGDATNIKASAGQVYAVTVSNINASPVYVKFYNSASAPTAGAGTPVVRIMCPGSTTGAGTNITVPVGAAFATGIGFTIVTGITDAASTGVTADQVLLNVYYK